MAKRPLRGLRRMGITQWQLCCTTGRIPLLGMQQAYHQQSPPPSRPSHLNFLSKGPASFDNQQQNQFNMPSRRSKKLGKTKPRTCYGQLSTYKQTSHRRCPTTPGLDHSPRVSRYFVSSPQPQIFLCTLCFTTCVLFDWFCVHPSSIIVFPCSLLSMYTLRFFFVPHSYHVKLFNVYD